MLSKKMPYAANQNVKYNGYSKQTVMLVVELLCI